MDSFVCSPFSTYQNFRSSPALGRGWDAAAKQPSWKQGKGGGITPFLGGPFTPLPSDYLDSYRRAQLQALLSQVGPALAPRPRRASTKEAAVQVSLRADAAVQCSLGPRTLPPTRTFGPAARRTPGRLAVYSPAPDRRFFAETAAPTEETPTADGGEKQQEGSAGAALPRRQEPVGTRREQTAAPRQRAAFQVRRDGVGGEPSSGTGRNHLMGSTVLPVLPRAGPVSPRAEEPPACQNPRVWIKAWQNGLGCKGP